MKIRSEKELLELMLDNQHLFSEGLCYWNMKMYWEDIINLEEYSILEKIIKNHKPFFHSLSSTNPYYWESGNIKPRIKWIKKRIKQSKS